MIGAASDMLEDDLRPTYTAWKKTPGPETNGAMLKALQPTIEGAIRTHVGEPNPLLISRARVMALQGLNSYDPKRGRLSSHMYYHLLGLKRANRQQTTILRVPERIQLDKFHLDNATKELTAQFGREPTDGQLADFTGFSPSRMSKVRSYKSGLSEGHISDLEEQGVGFAGGGVTVPNAKPQRSHWQELVYDELDDHHKNCTVLSVTISPGSAGTSKTSALRKYRTVPSGRRIRACMSMYPTLWEESRCPRMAS